MQMFQWDSNGCHSLPTLKLFVALDFSRVSLCMTMGYTDGTSTHPPLVVKHLLTSPTVGQAKPSSRIQGRCILTHGIHNLGTEFKQIVNSLCMCCMCTLGYLTIVAHYYSKEVEEEEKKREEKEKKTERSKFPISIALTIAHTIAVPGHARPGWCRVVSCRAHAPCTPHINPACAVVCCREAQIRINRPCRGEAPQEGLRFGSLGS